MTLFKKLIGTFLLLFLLLAFAPMDPDLLQKLVNSLQKWTDDNPQEKVYLHMDKPYYALGDTIWFKAYITTGSRHQLSAISGALYVDLITEKDSLVRTLKLPVNAGMSMGDLTLGDDLQQGNYRIRAYTQWMRNAGEDYFFDRTFTVGTLLVNEIVSTSKYRYETIDDNTSLIATLGYTDKEGIPLADEKVEYDIILNNQKVYSKSVRTNDLGQIKVAISNEQQIDLRGGYIRTRMKPRSNKGNKVISTDFPIKAGRWQSDIQFFPEGGNLINGISSKVAFKAIGIDGVGIAVKGKILEDGSKEILDFETLKFGMGSFTIIPVAGKSYSARVMLPDSTEQTIELPKASNEGYLLSVYQPNQDSVLVRIRVSPKALALAIKELKPIYVNLIAQIRGETMAATSIEISQPITSFWLEKDAYPSGIAQFTLFSESGEPINERIAFIKGRDQMSLKLTASKKNYKSKEKVEFELEARDRNDEPTSGNFSVTVIDESKVPYEEDLESTILSNLLLTSDLKGYIERPNYYFTQQTGEANKALDNLMLTQGYRRFSWKQIAADTAINNPGKAYLTNSRFKPEGLGINISGVVKSLNGSIAPRAKLTLMALKLGIVLSTAADESGRFKFEGLVMRDSVQFSLQARTENNGAKVEIILDTIQRIHVSKNKSIADINKDIPGTLSVYAVNGRNQEAFYEKTGQLNRVQRLREVRISATRKKDVGYSAQGLLRIPEGHADNSVNLENEKPAANLGIMLRTMLPNVKFKEHTPDPLSPEVIFDFPHFYNVSTRKLEPMKIILDGRELRAMEAGGVFNNTTLDPADIARIDIVISNAALLSVLGGPSILVYTKKQRRTVYNPSMVTISPKGFNKAKTFYSPKYDPTNQQMPDFRSTIYWNANLKTNTDGKMSFDFYNSDSPGRYKVIIEGINSEGELGRLVYHYSLDGE